MKLLVEEWDVCDRCDRIQRPGRQALPLAGAGPVQRGDSGLRDAKAAADAVGQQHA